MRTRLIFSMLVASLVAGCGGVDGAGDASDGAEGEDFTLDATFVTYQPRESALSDAAQWWMDEVEAQTDGRVTFETHYDASLVGAAELRDYVRTGSAEVGLFAPGYHLDDFMLSEGLLQVPFTTSNVPAFMEAISELYETNEAAAAEWNDQNLHLLSILPSTDAAMGTTQPVTGIDDLSGLSIRGQPGAGINRGLELVGSNPVSMELVEVYESAQRGVVDGWLGLPPDSAVSIGLHEVTDYWADPGIGLFASLALMMPNDFWETLPADVQEIMADAAEGMRDTYLDAVAEREGAACETIEEAGVEVHVFSDDDRDRWADMLVDEQFDAWADSVSDAVDPDEYFSEYREHLERFETELGDFEGGVGRCA